MLTPQNQLSSPHPGHEQQRADTVILVYSGVSGLRALLLDVLKKAVGREECSLCEITYSPVGMRRAWTQCAARLGVTVSEMHRDQLPEAWGIQSADLPCVLGRDRDAHPFVLLTRDHILACQRSPEALERAILDALNRAHAS
jgi:hypothetical protein